ncbi:hypothetical protein EC844_103120 [Acinetobacter calcoaceticus]|uniref:Uncharacterized protein n=1 Tax=Acinetobacter calcoaceticus TaxID=471 RepID=A0A4R1Y2T9_ACICA|nr:hypothetical protein EC844_103120 [Acinetobacter calcoaceticus]
MILSVLHLLGIIAAYMLMQRYPYPPQPKDMSGLFYLIVVSIGAIAGLIILAISLPRLNAAVAYLRLGKFLLACCYWLSSSIIFICLSSTAYLYNQVAVIWIFVILFLSALYFSIFQLADMRRKDYLILLGIFILIATLIVK